MFVPHTTIKLPAFFPLIFLLIIFHLPIAQAVNWELQHPLPTEHNLRAVWSAGNDDVFAVGDFGTILHYDGKNWTAMRSGTRKNLSAIWGSSNNDVFAVGSHGTILHYNGRGWANLSSSALALNDDFSGVWGSSSSDVFVVGHNGTILHYNGDSWTMMSNDTEEHFTSVWGNSGNDVFAVGSVKHKGLILHYDGHHWTTMNAGTLDPLKDIWGSSGHDVFAVGGRGNFNSDNGIIFHYDGTSWTPMNNEAQNTIISVWGSGSNDVFVLSCEEGSFFDPNSEIHHYDGSSWTVMSSNFSKPLSKVWGNSGDDVFAVGGNEHGSSGGTILHYDGSNWRAMNNSSTSESLTSIWGSNGSDVFVVGQRNDGLILHYNGNDWIEMDSGTSAFLHNVWGSSSSDVFAVGSSGTILHYDGNEWTSMRSGTSSTLQGIWGSNDHNVFAVGGNTILHYDGGGWVLMSSITSEYLTGVWGSSDNDIFSVGSNGTILHYNGNDWTTMNSGTSEDLKGVWGSSNKDVFAVGNDGIVLRYDGNNWKTMISGTSNTLNSIWGNSNSDIFATENAFSTEGTIMHYNGSAWERMSTNGEEQLNGVWGSNRNDVFAVGNDGVILHFDGKFEIIDEMELVYIPLNQPCRIVATNYDYTPFTSYQSQQSFLAWGYQNQLIQQRGDTCLPENNLKPSAMVVNITVGAATNKAKGSIVAYPFGAATSTASLINFQANNIANSSIITLTPEGSKHFTVRTNINGFNLGGSRHVEVKIDTLGYFYPKETLATTPNLGLSYIPLSQPCRIVNTSSVNKPFHHTVRKKQEFLAWGTALALDRQRDADGKTNLGACLPEANMTPAAMMANFTVAAKGLKSIGNVVPFEHGTASPTTSLVNFTANNIANASIVSLNTETTPHFDVEARIFGNNPGGSKQAHLLVDAQGYFYSQDELTAAGKTGLSYIPLSQPCRIVDTRGIQKPFHFQTRKTQAFKAWGTTDQLNLQRGNKGLSACQPKSGMTPTAVMANVTVAAKRYQSRGNVVAYPTGGPIPKSSLVNFTSNNIANSSIIALNPENAQHFSVTADIRNTVPGGSKQTDVIVDVIGYFYP